MYCSVLGCPLEYYAKGFCNKHYHLKWRSIHTPKKPRKSYDFYTPKGLECWSKRVRKRDEMLCVVCGSKADLAHHLFPKKVFPRLSLNTNNGVSLCRLHHREIHSLNPSI